MASGGASASSSGRSAASLGPTLQRRAVASAMQRVAPALACRLAGACGPCSDRAKASRDLGGSALAAASSPQVIHPNRSRRRSLQARGRRNCRQRGSCLAARCCPAPVLLAAQRHGCVRPAAPGAWCWGAARLACHALPPLRGGGGGCSAGLLLTALHCIPHHAQSAATDARLDFVLHGAPAAGAPTKVSGNHVG